jgi:hypothetical protein
LTIGKLANHHDVDKTANAVRDRCRLLMGLDEIVDGRSEQLLDQDAETGKWGLTHQIDTSARGEIPDNTRTLLKRAEDEMVRQMRAHGYLREEVGEVVGVTTRTIRKKERSAKAYQFPLDLVAGSEARIDHRGRSEETQSVSDTTGDTVASESTAADQTGATTMEAAADEQSAEAERDSDPDASDEQGAVAIVAAPQSAEVGNMWPTVGSLARFPEAEEYVFVLNVSRARDKLQGVRTSRLSEETCAQIAAAGEPSQLERVADAVRLMTEGPHCSGDADGYEPVPLETVVNPDLLLEGFTGRQ